MHFPKGSGLESHNFKSKDNGHPSITNCNRAYFAEMAPRGLQEGRVKKEGVCFASQYLVKVSQKKEKTSIDAGKIKGSTYLNLYEQLGVEQYRGFIEVSSALGCRQNMRFHNLGSRG